MKRASILLIGFGIVIAVVLIAFPSRVFSPELQAPQTQQPEQSQQEDPEPSFNKDQHSLTDPASIWVIVSKVRPLQPIDYAPRNLIDVGNGQLLRKVAADALQEMLTDAQKQGHEINTLSGYRSYQTQQAVYNREVQTYGQNVADTQSARPGHSEHQTGLVIDLGGGGCGIEDCFGNTAEYKWLTQNAHKYGFLQRYTTGKQAITGYRAEPWHWRYVGPDLATEMRRQNTETLEEFFGVVPESQPW